MCTNIVTKAAVHGSAKGRGGWVAIDAANVSYDHPFHAPFEHAVNIDFVRQAGEPGERVAVELEPASARALAAAILDALAEGEAALS